MFYQQLSNKLLAKAVCVETLSLWSMACSTYSYSKHCIAPSRSDVCLIGARDNRYRLPTYILRLMLYEQHILIVLHRALQLHSSLQRVHITYCPLLLFFDVAHKGWILDSTVKIDSSRIECGPVMHWWLFRGPTHTLFRLPPPSVPYK